MESNSNLGGIRSVNKTDALEKWSKQEAQHRPPGGQRGLPCFGVTGTKWGLIFPHCGSLDLPITVLMDLTYI
jgi:hypothetical protein